MDRPSASDHAALHKLYYRIGEVADLVGVQTHVLRYWETEFQSIRPQKSKRGQRVYSRRDVETLIKVKHLLKERGFTIAGARKALRERAAEAVEALHATAVETSLATATTTALAAAPQSTALADGAARDVASRPLEVARANASVARLRGRLASLRDEAVALLGTFGG